MDPYISAFDVQRMLIGDAPPLFMLEIIFRTAVVYVYTLLLLRWLGSRAIGQLSTVEFLLVIALGSAVGDAMFYPEVPLLHALVVVTLVVLANKGLDLLLARNRHVEHAIDGKPQEAIQHGVICPAVLAGTALTQRELFQQLRQHGVEQLGQVEHAYIETDGVLTVFKSEDPRAGLAIVPPWEIEAPTAINPREHGSDLVACRRCGVVSAGGAHVPVNDSCKHEAWVIAQP
ncbi:YetF domain-containing protein [Devosia sp. 2618]|uniref:DUF421 domain-containing protein n=1 Tax=Devosia sp. 2618 TaxID=3156454 RepID=UPI0033925923